MGAEVQGEGQREGGASGGRGSGLGSCGPPIFRALPLLLVTTESFPPKKCTNKCKR